MRRRRSPSIHMKLIFGLILPVLVSSQTYDAVPIGRPFLRPPPSPRQEEAPAPVLARGYQPPPRPSNFQPPKSYPSFRQPSLNLDSRPRQFVPNGPQFNWQMQQLQQQHPQRFQSSRTIPQTPPSFLPPQNHFRAGAPGQIPRTQELQNHQIPQFQGPHQLDPVNNIIIHLYLNAKDRMPSHAEIKTPVRGLFGIGTSHGGPGSHSDPIVITKDFDRDTLEFVDEGQVKNGSPSNIIEVKATVSTPNRQLENTVNHAVNQELDRAIPKVMDRMRGSTMTMDNGMRKELEEALVDELAKNLGETIDNTDITEEDLNKLIEEGFEEAIKPEETTPTSRPTRPVTRPTTTQRPTTVTDFNNDNDYEDSEDISQTTRGTVATASPQTPPTTRTTRPTTTTTTTRIVVTSPTTTSTTATTRTWNRPTQAPPTQTPPTTTTEAPPTIGWTRPTDGHIHVMPGIRVTETSSTSTTTTTTTTQAPPPTTRTTWAPPPTTSTPTTTTTTTQTPPTQAPTARPTWAPWTPPSTEAPPPTTTTTEAPPPTVRPTWAPWTSPTTTTTTTTTQAPTPTTRPTWAPWTPPTTTTQAPPPTVRQTWAPWTPPTTTTTTTTTTVPTYRPPTSIVTFSPPDSEDSEEVQHIGGQFHHVTPDIPTRRPPLIEVPPSTGPTHPHHGIVNLESNEEDLESTVTSRPVAMYTTERSTAIHNLPTKPSSAPTLHPSTFSPPLTSKPKSHSTSSEEIQPNFVIPSGQCPTPNQPNLDKNRTDILFLLDSSDNFNEQRFHGAIKLIGETVSQFNNFGSEGVQVSLVQYNDEPYLEFSLRKHNCKKHLLDDIADTEFMTGGSQLTKALEKVSQFAFTKKRGDRADAENVLIIVTDGQSDGRIQEPTRLAKENNVTVLVISTIEADKQFVNELSGNKAENLFGFDGNGLDGHNLAWKLAQRIATSSGPTVPAGPKNTGILSPVLPEIPENTGNSENSAETTVTRRPENPENTETSGIIDLECVGDGFKIQVNPPEGFRGVAVVKGYQDDVRCKATAHSSTPLNLFISNEECGVTQVKSSDPKGLNSSLVLHLLHENDLNTAEDRAYLLQCFIGTPDEDAVLSTNLDVVRSELAIAETISLSTLPPTCTYSIRRDGPDGRVVSKAVVGQTVWHRWECDGTNETTQAYGIQIHSCYASDDVERKFAFVDPRGCSSDLALLTDLTYADDSLTAWAASHVFNVHDAESLKFVCKLSLCTRDGDGCEGVTPPSCGNTNKSGLLLTKRLTKGLNSVDEALTSALSTNVKLSSGSADGLEDVLKSAVSSYLFWVIALVAVAAIVAISLLSRNVAESSETATTCSDPTNMSESQDFGGSIRSISSPLPNPRFADFMKSFDRNRYV